MTLDGVVWSGAVPLVRDAVRPVVSNGDQVLVGMPIGPTRTGTAILFNLDLDRTNLIRSPDWPILISNLVEMRRQSLPGPERWNYRSGEWVRVRLDRDPKGPLRYRCGAVERALPAGRQLEFIAPSPGGLLQILEGDQVLFEIGVNFLDEVETALRQSVDGRCRRSSPTSPACAPRAGAASDPLFWILLAIGGAAMLVNWCLLSAGPPSARGPACRPGPDVMLLFPGLLLLIVPLLVVYFWRGRSSGIGGIVRIVVLVGLALLASVPLARLGGKGVDVVVVADLSRSMPADSRRARSRSSSSSSSSARPAIASASSRSARRRASSGCRRSSARPRDFVQEVDRTAAISAARSRLAASLIPRGRPGRIDRAVGRRVERHAGDGGGARRGGARRADRLPAVQPRRRGRHRGRVARPARRRGRARAVPVHRVGAHRPHGRDRRRAVSRRRRGREDDDARFSRARRN